MKSLPEIVHANKEETVITAEDKLETAFEIRAEHVQGTPAYFTLKLEHDCDNQGIVTLDLAWVKCPWCGKGVPDRIRRVFRQK